MFPRKTLWYGLVLTLSFEACSSPDQPLPTEPIPSFTRAGPVPGALVSVPAGSATRRIWPFASADLASPDDPINVVFSGKASPRQIRNALLRLDGNRGAPFPPVFPFTCTWSDAIGGLMAGFGEKAGWAGGAIQLQCGTYGPIRFHLRLFDLGDVTVGNVHFEVVITGTADHQVLSWEMAEQLVTYDMARSGLLAAAPSPTGPINPAPAHRTIPSIIYGSLPSDLRQLINGPPVPSADVGIATDGRATVFVVRSEAPPAPAPAEQRMTLTYDQVIPKPFCATGPTDFVLVRGPVTLVQRVNDPGNGPYEMRFHAEGALQVVPIDLATGQPAGAPLAATISEWQRSRADRAGGTVDGVQSQVLEPKHAEGAGRLFIRLSLAPGKRPHYRRTESCQGDR